MTQHQQFQIYKDQEQLDRWYVVNLEDGVPMYRVFTGKEAEASARSTAVELNQRGGGGCAAAR